MSATPHNVTIKIILSTTMATHSLVLSVILYVILVLMCRSKRQPLLLIFNLFVLCQYLLRFFMRHTLNRTRSIDLGGILDLFRFSMWVVYVFE